MDISRGDFFVKNNAILMGSMKNTSTPTPLFSSFSNAHPLLARECFPHHRHALRKQQSSIATGRVLVAQNRIALVTEGCTSGDDRKFAVFFNLLTLMSQPNPLLETRKFHATRNFFVA